MKEEPKHIWRIRRAKPDRLMSKAGESEPLSNCVGDFQCVEIYGEKPCGICCEPHYLPIHGSQQDWGTLVEWTACFDCGKFGHGMECSHAGRGFSFACEGCYKLFETGLRMLSCYFFLALLTDWPFSMYETQQVAAECGRFVTGRSASVIFHFRVSPQI